MKQMKNALTIRLSDLDETRSILESMARDLASNYQRRVQGALGAAGQGPQPTAQGQPTTQSQDQITQRQRLLAQKQQEQMNQAQKQRQQAQQRTKQQQQQQQSAPAPLNAANLEKNSEALKNQKASGRGFKAPVAPTTAQPPFPFGAASPHGNPSYHGKAKDMNLQIPPRKRAKLDKQGGQGSQAATPSPKTATKTSPPQEAQRPSEPPKPVLVCREPECQGSTVGYATEEALQKHVNEEHVKPKENPIKFCSENLALALGLEADGKVKKEDAMSRTASKQGQTPGHLGLGTPKSQDGVAMKRSTSSQSRMLGTKGASGSPDPWANSSFDCQALLNKLGLPNGINSVAFDPSTIRTLTPKDTPDSAKDSGSSEPNSDILEGPVPEFDVNWHTLDSDVLLNMTNPNFGASFTAFDNSNAGTMDPSLLMNHASPGEPDWSDVKVDFDAPLRFDTGQFFMDVK